MAEISLNSWLYASFPDWVPHYTLEHTLDRVDEIGYDAIELGAGGGHAWPQNMQGDRLERIQDHVDKTDLTVSSICPCLGGGPGLNPASPNPQRREATREHYMGCLDLAEAFDTDIVIWVGGWYLANQTYEEAWENMRGVFEDVVEAAEQKDKILAIEATPTFSNLVNTPHDTLRLYNEVDSENVGTMFDTVYAGALGDSLSYYVEQLGDSLVHIHLSDNDRLPPGEGNMTFQPMFDRLNDYGYEGTYTVEIFGNHLTPDEAALTTLGNLQEMIP